MKRDAYLLFEEEQLNRGIPLDQAVHQLKQLKVETPSWGYSDQGTRFKVFQQEPSAHNPYHRIDDAAEVHRLTGLCPTVALHIPWDRTTDYGHLARYAQNQGVGIGSINPNLFQEEEYRFGSVCNSRPQVRKKAVEHLLECLNIARIVGSKEISLWLADGTNYPGQASMRKRMNWMYESLSEIYAQMTSSERLLIEYKMFEPAFYHTDLADWGMALHQANRLGERAQVLVDMGHHAQGTNIEHIVSFLLNEGKLGGFHFNGRKYADDDLITGSTNPYELFLIFHQILDALYDEEHPAVQRTAAHISYMIDQSHNIEEKIPAMLRSVLNVQTLYAKALLINRKRLAEAQEQQDVLTAENEVRRAFELDVRPLLAMVREEAGLPTDPFMAYATGSYREHVMNRQ